MHSLFDDVGGGGVGGGGDVVLLISHNQPSASVSWMFLFDFQPVKD